MLEICHFRRHVRCPVTTRQQQTAFINSSLRQKLRLPHLMLILLMGGEIAQNKFYEYPIYTSPFTDGYH